MRLRFFFSSCFLCLFLCSLTIHLSVVQRRLPVALYDLEARVAQTKVIAIELRVSISGKLTAESETVEYTRPVRGIGRLSCTPRKISQGSAWPIDLQDTAHILRDQCQQNCLLHAFDHGAYGFEGLGIVQLCAACFLPTIPSLASPPWKSSTSLSHDTIARQSVPNSFFTASVQHPRRRLTWCHTDMPVLPQCEGVCKDKTQCNRSLAEGRRYCQTHATQESHSLKRKCLYTTVVRKKHRTWRDGLYTWNRFNGQVKLYDERGMKMDEAFGFGEEPMPSACYQLSSFELEIQLDSDEEGSGDDSSEPPAQGGAHEHDVRVLLS